MLHDLWGDVGTGRLLRVRFLVLQLMLALIPIGVGVALSVLLSGAVITASSVLGAGSELGASAAAGDGAALWRTLAGYVLMAVFGAMVVALAFAQLNVIAKRARDTGLPGWFVAATLAVLVAVFPTIAGVIVLILCVIPSDALKRGAPAPS